MLISLSIQVGLEITAIHLVLISTLNEIAIPKLFGVSELPEMA